MTIEGKLYEANLLSWYPSKLDLTQIGSSVHLLPRMLLSWVAVQKNLKDIGYLSVDVFISGKRDNWRGTLILLLSCGFSSFLLSSLLLLYLLFSLRCDLAVAGGIVACSGTLLIVVLFLSKKVRCLGTLIIISLFMKKSRNLLLTAGTSLVVLRNFRNTLENLTGLARSLICNLKAKKADIIAPFSPYVKLLKWIVNRLKSITDFGVFTVDSKLKFSPILELEDSKLNEVEQKLNETVKYAQSIMNKVFSVAENMFPALSFLVLLMFILLHIKKFHSDLKYQNRFISGKFVEFDEKQKAEGKPHVLPLTQKEKKLYTALLSVRPTAEEGKAILKFGVPVISHFVVWVIFITVDALLYNFVDIVTRRLSEMEPFHIPVLMNTKVSMLMISESDFWILQVLFQSNKHSLLFYSSSQIATVVGISFTEEKHQEEFSYSVVLFEKKCLPQPKLLLYNSVIPLAAILLTLLVMALMAAKVAQLRLMICEHFFSSAAEARVEYLHAKILKKRLKQGVCCITSAYFKVCITTYHWLNQPICMMLQECNCYFCVPFSATFLVPSDLQTQREATNCCVIPSREKKKLLHVHCTKAVIFWPGQSAV